MESKNAALVAAVFIDLPEYVQKVQQVSSLQTANHDMNDVYK